MLTILLPSCIDCLETWDPQPPGTLMACPSLHRVCFTLYPLKGQHTLGERGPGVLSKYFPNFVRSRILRRQCAESSLVSCDAIGAAWPEVRIPVKSRNFLSFTNVPYRPTQPGYRGSFPGLKLPESEVNLSSIWFRD